MKAIWKWIRSPAYWRLSAIAVGLYLVIAVLGKTGDWVLSLLLLLGFYFFWRYAKKAIEAANGIKEKK